MQALSQDLVGLDSGCVVIANLTYPELQRSNVAAVGYRTVSIVIDLEVRVV